MAGPQGPAFSLPIFLRQSVQMPELPEVETIRRGLSKSLVGQKIVSVNVRVPKLFVGFPEMLEGQKILEIERRAKMLIWKLEKSYIMIHLKMTGQLIYVPKKGEMIIGGHPDKVYTLDLPHKHTHVIFELENGTLYFNDLRKFGWIKVLTEPEQIRDAVKEVGPEYDWPEFTLEYFQKKLEKRKTITIKQALLDQTIVAGLGNIYADETLFCAKVLPRRKIISLTNEEYQKFFTCIPEVLDKSLHHGGTSSQHYVQSDGTLGTYLKVANVYKREGQPCKVCGTPIERIKIAGRSSHFCPRCQK
jgi:formamidopyrimidine-DNA glycosylase